MSDPTDLLKIPPHSIEAEQSVLGGLMLDNHAWEKIADRVAEEDFYRYDHRLIFRAIVDLAEDDQPMDIITLSEWLGKRGDLEDAGGFAYLGTMAKDTPSAANIQAYADIVRERSVLRQLIGVGTDIADSAFNPGEKASKTLLDEAESAVFKIAEQGARQGQNFKPMKRLLKSTLERIKLLSMTTSTLTGLPTGYPDLDTMTSGFQKGDLIIVAGRPSMGKTTLAMNFAEYIALGHINAKEESKSKAKSVAIFSMEMPAEQLVLRMLASMGKINQTGLRTGNLTEDDWPRISQAIGMFANSSLFIDDSPALSPTEIRARSRRLAREHGGLDLIVLDYIQLMQSNNGKSENRSSEISEISRGLKSLAKELEVPIIALSQLNRSLEQRPNKRPVMSDLRESGAIEQDADLIIFIYRDKVYNPESAEQDSSEIIIAKQRNGPIGTIRLTFVGQHSRFNSFSADVYNSNDTSPNNSANKAVQNTPNQPFNQPSKMPKNLKKKQ